MEFLVHEIALYKWMSRNPAFFQQVPKLIILDLFFVVNSSNERKKTLLVQLLADESK